MNAMTKWNPFKEMDDLSTRLSTLWGLSPSRLGNGKDENLTVADWHPLVDITEDDKEYVIKAELPEVDKKDVKVTVDNGVLTVSGERHFEKEENGKKYHRVERVYGTFNRSFTVPEDADPNKVSAEYKNGILLVHLAKAPEARPRTVEVKVA